MAKSKSDPFAKLKNSPPSPTPSKKQEPKVVVRTQVKKKVGRPSSFKEETTRLSVVVPTETVKAMQRALPDTAFKNQSQLINAAILAFLNKNT